MAQKMEMALFQSVEGSMVSDDGKLFMLQVKLRQAATYC